MLPDLTESRAGAAAYAALAEFERLTALLPLAPGLADRMAVAEVIAQRYARYRELLERAGAAGDPQPAMAAAAPAIEDALRRVESEDWWQALAAAVFGGALTEELFEIMLGDQAGAAEPEQDGAASAGVEAKAADAWAAQRLRAALAEDPVLAARIAMWGRRLVGEAIVLAREFGGERYPELADRLAASHARRLEDFGLAG
ncbi:MAG TPA: ferritin-like fold-containing protein [Actinocrinis sp.]|uniref:ferritin-like fold-containing protein n=1 Tax=Actinocrinis sp. TaxID=1920516 RepID=UPI002D559649|nr:ferritin-like fold-containing protein [Actinocrinis sp.]HZU57229.1 ferritin-like fold-containing protein [Actinocrinis sp.]